jgi:hypothetical protein
MDDRHVAPEQVRGDHAREVDGVLRAAERRRVAQLGLLGVVDGRLHRDCHREGVDPLGDAVLGEKLRAEEASVLLPEEDLDRHHLGARVIAGVGVLVEVACRITVRASRGERRATYRPADVISSFHRSSGSADR